jgi:hypothetical protein
VKKDALLSSELPPAVIQFLLEPFQFEPKMIVLPGIVRCLVSVGLHGSCLLDRPAAAAASIFLANCSFNIAFLNRKNGSMRRPVLAYLAQLWLPPDPCGLDRDPATD